jgi:ATP-binding cassette subfamily B protein
VKLTWPVERLPEALAEVAERSGMAPERRTGGPSRAPEPAALQTWLSDHASALGLETEDVAGDLAQLDAMVRAGGPALLRVGTGPDAGVLVRLATPARRGRVALLGPDLRVHHVAIESVVTTIVEATKAPWIAEVDRLLDVVKVPPSRRDRARRQLLRDRSEGRPFPLGWVVRLPPAAAPALLARQARLPSRALGVAALHLVHLLLTTGAWWVVGRAVLSGQLDSGWMWAWGLLVLTTAPVYALLTWREAELAVEAGSLIRQRLFGGALKLMPEETRHLGIGQMIGRVIEASAVESLATSGGLLAAFSLLELLFAAAILAEGAGGWAHAAVLGTWIALGLLAGWRYHRRRAEWTEQRLAMTHALIEGMVGHRTRIAQEPADRWHEAEDTALSAYVVRSQRLDAAFVRFVSLFPAGWLALGLATILPGLVRGDVGLGALAVSIGGVLMAWGSLRTFASGLTKLSGAAIAWREVRSLFAAAGRPESIAIPSPTPPTPRHVPDGGPPVVEARGLRFAHAGRSRAVLDELSVRVAPGERILLEGPSGGGKSTLGSLLAGLRPPDSGLLLLNGVDLRTVGSEAWRRRVVSVPQFHENHIFGNTLAFNLLMGRAWPPTPKDMADAERVCRSLGLGPLLERMPGGLLQQVGEMGWQLSHGEKSRIMLARALLQDADLLILDESFAALDPENLGLALRVVLDRPGALIVIAHP